MTRTSHWRFRRTQHDGDEPVPDHASIFVTVGTELPFDRLVGAIDEWAGRNQCGSDVFAQIGDTDRHPEYIGWTHRLEGHEFRELFLGADLVVAHAGMGTILSALELSRPLVVVPRRADLGEHRSDHQLATVRHLVALGLVDAAMTEQEVVDRLDGDHDAVVPPAIGPYASDRLISEVRGAIVGGAPPTTLPGTDRRPGSPRPA